MSFKLNVFRLKKPITELGIKVAQYKIVNLGDSENRFRVLNDLRQKASEILGTIMGTYAPPNEEDVYILAFNPKKTPDELEVNGFSLKLVKIEEDIAGKYIDPIRRLFYELTRLKLEYHGFWQDKYNKYYSLKPDSIIRGKFGEYRVYRGVFFRYEIMDSYSWLIIDSITRVVMNDSVWTIISKYGEDKVKKIIKDRYIVVTQVRGKIQTLRINQVSRLRTDLRAGRDKVIKIDDKKYTVKEYYSEYRGLPEIAEQIDDNEPLIEVKGRNTSYWYAPSMAHLVLRTSDIEEDIDEIKEEIYLTPERRFNQIRRFLKVINPLFSPNHVTIPEFKFKETPENFKTEIIDPQDLKLGKGSINLRDNFDRYSSFLKSSLKDLGPAKPSPSLSGQDRFAIAYPREYLTESQVREFYGDIRSLARKYLGAYLPRQNRVYVWEYSEGDIVSIHENYNRFKDLIRAVICILPKEDDPLYFEFKELFSEKPCQMATSDLVLKKYSLPTERQHIYLNSILNLACGLLGKMGMRPWLLAKEMKGDLYIGIDTKPGKVAIFTLIDSKGDYIDEVYRSIRGSKIDEETIKDVIMKLLLDSRKLLPKEKPAHIVIHRDGEVHYSEELGLKSAKKSLEDRGIKVQFTLVSIRETTPYRIFEEQEDKLASCPSGVFAELRENMGLLACVGWPLIEQGMAKPLLIEIIRNDREDYTLHDAISEVYYLSFMHWNCITKKLRMPITIKYADEYAVFAEMDIDITGPPL